MTPESSITDETAPSGFLGRLMGVYFSPGDTFKGFAEKPGIWGPIIALVILGGVMGFLIFSKVDFTQMMTAQMDQMIESGRITKEQAPQIIAQQATFAKYAAFVGGLVGNIILALIVAGVFKLITLVMGKENTFPSLLSVTLYTFLAVGIISSLIFAAMIFVKGPDFDIQNPIGSNLETILLLLLDKDALPKFIWRLARSVDLFYIWMIVLLSIGYSAVTYRLKATTVGVVLGVLYFGLSIVGAALGTMFGG